MSDENNVLTIVITRIPGERMAVVDTHESQIDQNSSRNVDLGRCGELAAVVSRIVDDWQVDGLNWRDKCRIVVGQMKSLAVEHLEIREFVERLPAILGFDENGRSVEV